MVSGLWLTKTFSCRRARTLRPGQPNLPSRVHAPGDGQPKLAWRANDNDAEEILSPLPWSRTRPTARAPGVDQGVSYACRAQLAVSPNGKTHEELALEAGLWLSATRPTEPRPATCNQRLRRHDLWRRYVSRRMRRRRRSSSPRERRGARSSRSAVPGDELDARHGRIVPSNLKASLR
jgi:hypothetical protein